MSIPPPPPPPPGVGRISHLVRETARAAADLDLVADDGGVYPDKRNLVKRLIEDPSNVPSWQALLDNQFCRAMKEAGKDDTNVLRGFRWYMKQDYHYVANLISYAEARLSKAETKQEYQSAMTQLSEAKAYTEHFFNICTSPQPDGLGIDATELLSTKKCQVLKDYISLIDSEAENENLVFSKVVMIGPLQSYSTIASDLYLLSKHNDTLWYKFWSEDNIGLGKPALIQQRFFIDTYKYWKDRYERASELFKQTCGFELALWDEALKNSNVNV